MSDSSKKQIIAIKLDHLSPESKKRNRSSSITMYALLYSVRKRNGHVLAMLGNGSSRSRTGSRSSSNCNEK